MAKQNSDTTPPSEEPGSSGVETPPNLSDARSYGGTADTQSDDLPRWVSSAIVTGTQAMATRLAIAAFVSLITVVIALAGGYYAVVELAVAPVKNELDLLRRDTKNWIDVERADRITLDQRIQSQFTAAAEDRKIFRETMSEIVQRLATAEAQNTAAAASLQDLRVANAKMLEVLGDIREKLGGIDARLANADPPHYVNGSQLAQQVFPDIDLREWRVASRAKTFTSDHLQLLEVKRILPNFKLEEPDKRPEFQNINPCAPNILQDNSPPWRGHDMALLC